jgi:hypothetical protein
MKLLVKPLFITLLTIIGWFITIPVSANAPTTPSQPVWTNQNCPGGICGDTKDFANWTAQFDIYWALWMSHKSKTDKGQETSVMTFIQDIILAATYFIWTVVTVALIFSWLLFVFSWADSSLRNRAKSWFKYALIWLVIVTLSVVIVRAIQFIAKWWS